MHDSIHRHKFTVYYADTDAGGVVYFPNYLTFMENARQEMMRILGFTFPTFMYYHCDVKYKSPALLGDVITVSTRVTDIGSSKLDIIQEIFRDTDNSSLVEMTSALAFVDDSGRPHRMPADMRAALEAACGTKLPATGA